jgi:hypothetical protein
MSPCPFFFSRSPVRASASLWYYPYPPQSYFLFRPFRLLSPSSISLQHWSLIRLLRYTTVFGRCRCEEVGRRSCRLSPVAGRRLQVAGRRLFQLER